MNGKILRTGTHHIRQAQDEFVSQLPSWMHFAARFLLVKYGDLVTDARGSMAGNVHARNRFGNYIRARTKPVNPKSARQSAARIAVMMLAEQWRESPMTDAFRLAWETYAGSVDWKNKLGETVSLTGFNHFVRSNAALIAIDGTILTDGPTDLGLPAGDPNMVVSNCSEATQTFDLAFDDGFDWCEEPGGYMVMFQGEPQNATRNFFNGPWRRCAYLSGFAAPGMVSPSNGIVDIGYTIIEGQKIWWEAHIIRADGRVSTKFRCDPVIAVA